MLKKESIKELNPNWPQIYDYPCRILITGGSGSGKTNSLLNIINHQSHIDKIHLSIEAKYKFLINKQESMGLKHFDDS